MKKIKIFNSEKEAKGLEGSLVESLKIIDGNDPLENFFEVFSGNFTPLQRLKSEAKSEAVSLNADYGVIINKYETMRNNSGHLQNLENCDNLLTIEVNFYKNKK